MKMKKSLSAILTVFALLVSSCSNWMKDDNLYSDIENGVKVANAAKINVYVRYAMTRQGKTDPDGSAIFKVQIPHEISATTETEYGFVRWAAFTTDFLATGDNQSKNKDFLFIDEEDYNTRLLPHEIQAPVVVFEDPYNPVTKVTINQKRDDLFLVPIVTQRPAVSLTIPARGSGGVVRNMSVRISFTKPMDPESFKNSEGVFDTITVTQGTQTVTADGDIEINSQDITDHFENPVFSKNQKMITLQFKSSALEEGYASQSSVTITISKEVKDIYGFSMVDDEKVSFTAGSSMDTLAPRITLLTGGKDAEFAKFQGMYKDSGLIGNLGTNTKMRLEGAKNAPTDDVDASFYDDLIENRVSKKVIIRTFAQDIAGSGEGLEDAELLETDVSLLAVRVKLLYNADGSEAADYAPVISSVGYVPQGNNTSLSGSYKDVVEFANEKDKLDNPQLSDQAFLNSRSGTLFEYDLSDGTKFPDGLYQIDVAAVDLVGNSGFAAGGNYSDEYGNGYASLFIVKDTTPPDILEAGNVEMFINNAAIDQSKYYNASDYSQIELAVKTSVEDQGHSRLRSNTVYWIVQPAEQPISASQENWKKATPSEKFGSLTPPTTDKTQHFVYALKDDLGNISKDTLPKYINYDCTKPAFGNLTWQVPTGSTPGITTGNVLTDQTLVIPLTEVTSGIQSLDISVYKDNGGQGYAPLKDDFKIYYAGSELNSSLYTLNDSKTVLSIKTPRVTSAEGETIKINGLQLADTNPTGNYDGLYTVKVSVTDAANNTSVVAQQNISNDSTKPVIQKIFIPNIRKAVRFEDSGNTPEYWIDYTKLSSLTGYSNPITDLEVIFNESNSGALVFDFSNSTVKLTSGSELYKGNTKISATVNESAQILTINNPSDAIRNDPSASSVKVQIKNAQIQLDSNNDAKVDIKISDTATNISDAFANITSSEGATEIPGIGKFKYDKEAISSSYYTLTDKETEANCDAAEAGYTNNAHINAKITLGTTTKASGVYSITIDGPAEFDSTTTITNSSNQTLTFDISDDKKTATFYKEVSGVKTHMLFNNAASSGKDVNISNLKLTGSEGSKSITLKAGHLSGVVNSGETQTIVLDTTPPAWVGKGLYTGSYGDNKVYPHPAEDMSSEGLTLTGISGLYFYRGVSGIKINAKFTDANPRVDSSNNKLIRWSGGNISGTTIDDDYINGTLEGDFTANVYDKAGNKSEEIAFHIEYVNSLITSDDSRKDIKTNLENEVELIVPEGADLQKNTFLNGVRSPEGPRSSASFDYYNGTQESNIWVFNYILKQFDGKNYQLKVPVHNYAAGGAKTVPMEQYGVSHQYTEFPSTADECAYDPFTPGAPNWHDYKANTSPVTDGHLSTKVDENGDIIITLPNHNCPPVSLWLKDACGNTEYVLLNPGLKDKLGTLTVCQTRPGEAKQGKRNQAVAYVIDNRVGVNDSHNGTGSNEEKTYPTNTLVSKSDISFYKKNSSSELPELKLNSLSDSCRFPYESNYNGLADLENNPSDYTLKSKIIVWQGSGKPAYEKFYDSNISGSAWYAWKEFYDAAGAGSAFTLKNNFPEFDNAAHDSDKYELWYIIEDRVGNYEVRQIKNGSKTDWLYDVTPPKLDVKQATNVNNIEGKNYYSNSSSVKYSIEDKQSGIQHNGSNSYTYSSFTSRVQLYPETGLTDYPLSGKTPDNDGKISIDDVKDWAENVANSVGLENGGSNIWIYQPDAPAFDSSPVQITAVNPPAGKRFITESSNGQWYIDSSRMITHIELKMTMDDREPLLGWIIKNDNSEPENRIYTVADTLSQNGNPAVLTQITQSGNVYTYSIDKTKTNKGQIVDDTGPTWNNYFNQKPLKFYAVNRAGIINIKKPIVINFTVKPVPALDGSLEYSDVIKYPSSSSTDNYIKSASKVIFKTKENPDKCTIFVGSDSVTFTLSSCLNTSTGKYEIPLGTDAVLKAASGAALKLVLSITGGEDSDEIELKGPANTNKWTFDETAPAISLTPSQGQNVAETNGIYYTKSANVKFAFTSDADTIKYMMKKKVGDGNYSTYSQIDLTNGGYQITSSDTLTEYSFVAVDKAGNQTQTPAVIKLQKDTTAPTGSITSYTLKYENSVTSSSYYRDSNDEQTNTRTIIYNPSYMNTVVFTPAITDAASGPDGNLYYKLNSGETTLMTDKTISLAENTGTAIYQIYAKDKVGNEALIKTFVFKVNKPAPSQTVTVKYNNQDLPHVSNNSYSTTYTPKYIGVDGGNAVVMPASAQFKITMNTATVLENSLSYAVTYIAHSDNLPALTVPSSGWLDAGMADGKVSVTVEGSKLTGEKNYIFIWFRDVLGNTAVYGLAYKGSADWQSGWWTPDLTGPTATVSLEFPGNTDGKYTSSSITDGLETITYNSNKISSVKVNGASSLNDTGLGITNKVLYYRESGASDPVAIGDAAISISTFTGDKTYQIFAKDDGGNETVFKNLKFVADGTAPEVTYSYSFNKQGGLPVSDYYTIEDTPDAEGYIVIKYNPDQLNNDKGGSFTVVTTGEYYKLMKKVAESNEQELTNGAISLSLGNGASVKISLIAYDSVWNGNTYAKLKFVADNTLGVQNGGGNGDPQDNKFSSGLFTGLLDTSKIVGSGDLAASQFSAMSGRGIIMNKDLDSSYISSATTGQSRAAKKAARAAKKAAKKAEKASAKTAKEKPLVQEIASQIEDLGITEAFVDSVVLEDLPLSEQIIKEDISQVTAKTDFVMSPVEKVEIADTIESAASSAAQAQQEKSSSKAALIVVMLAILSALAGAWYLRKGRK